MAASKQKRTIKRSAKTGRFTRGSVASVVKAVHVSPDKGNWVVHKTGAKRVSKQFESEDEAVRFAEEISRRTSSGLIVHRSDGKIVRGKRTVLLGQKTLSQ